MTPIEHALTMWTMGDLRRLAKAYNVVVGNIITDILKAQHEYVMKSKEKERV